MGFWNKAVLVVCLGCLLGAGSATAGAKGYESCGAREAKARVTAAHRATLRAEAREREARHVLDATRAEIGQYGVGVGRWVWLARDCGWGWAQLPELVYVIDRESGGSPMALNASSEAAGLLQLMPQWYHGEWGYPAFNPFNPRENLTAGWWMWRHSGWSPWAL